MELEQIVYFVIAWLAIALIAGVVVGRRLKRSVVRQGRSD